MYRHYNQWRYFFTKRRSWNRAIIQTLWNESVLYEKGSDFSVKTTVHIHGLFEKFGFDEVFGRSAVMELLGLKGSGASKLLSNLVQADIIEPVSGHGKGKYKFKK